MEKMQRSGDLSKVICPGCNSSKTTWGFNYPGDAKYRGSGNSIFCETCDIYYFPETQTYRETGVYDSFNKKSIYFPIKYLKMKVFW